MFQSLAPGFLIASPPLGDPNFDQTVVLLVTHNEEGALGFVVNRTAPLTVGELLQHAGYDHGHHDPSRVWLAGPVQPGSGWVLLDDPTLAPSDKVLKVNQRLRVSSSRAVFDQLAEDIAQGRAQATRRLVMLGYSGWTADQLEDEIAQGAWLPTPLDESILFDVEPDKRWTRAYALLGLTPTHLMSMRHVGQA